MTKDGPSGPAAFWLAVLAGGTLAGVFDILYAITFWHFNGRSALWVLQSVAMGWYGRASSTMGWTSGGIGLASHFAITIAVAALYGLTWRRVDWMRTRWVACGLFFGVLVYLFMNYVVIPLSAAPFRTPLTLSNLAQGFVSHALLVGLPIAACLRYAQAAWARK
ncbi:hypothetical protein BWI17_10540 [Betaproteobacteria bacterium GR16-43]|nr:hypothetical protein BWI17_10540 [Betaproteobacteria bacterium GR16-43]